MDYTPPLAVYLLEHHEPLVLSLARQALGEGREHAVTLSAAPGQKSLSASEIAEGGDMGVTSPEPENGAAAVVRLHTHPAETQVTFSTRDIVAFTRTALANTPPGRLPNGPLGYGVIGRRGGDVADDEAHLQTIEPNEAWASLGLVDRDRVQRAVMARANDAATRNEDNPLFDVLDPYVRRSSVEFSTAEREHERQPGPGHSYRGP